MQWHWEFRDDTLEQGKSSFTTALTPLCSLVDACHSPSRYCRSYPGLASAVFPHRFKLHLVGEFLASSFVLGGSLVRTTLGVVAASEVVVDLLVPERRRRDWERTVAVGVISLIWVSLPLSFLDDLLLFVDVPPPIHSSSFRSFCLRYFNSSASRIRSTL